MTNSKVPLIFRKKISGGYVDRINPCPKCGNTMLQYHVNIFNKKMSVEIEHSDENIRNCTEVYSL